MSQKQSFGMMDEGYFVPRTQIFDWINNLLHLNLTKIQQLGSGAVYCQIVDSIHPGKVSMNKVNWRAKNDYEFISNLKILQSAFEKVGIKKHVEVQKLARAKYQDNLQFIQWLKRYSDLNGGGKDGSYNAEERRGGAVVDFGFAQKIVIPKSYNGSGQVIPKNQKSEATQKKVKQFTSPTSNKDQYKSKQHKKDSNPNGVYSSKKVQGLDTKRLRQLQKTLHDIQKIAQSNKSSQIRMNQIQSILKIKKQQQEQIEPQEQIGQKDNGDV